MKTYKSEQVIGKLEKRKGGYFFLKMDAALINQFEHKRHTRFICKLDRKITFRCGLNHLGDGNFFIIISTKNLKSIEKNTGDTVFFELEVDPNPLGVDIPEVLQVVLDQDEHLKKAFDSLTLGKKRSVIHAVIKIKDIDKQIKRSIQAINDVTKPRPKKQL